MTTASCELPATPALRLESASPAGVRCVREMSTTCSSQYLVITHRYRFLGCEWVHGAVCTITTPLPPTRTDGRATLPPWGKV